MLMSKMLIILSTFICLNGFNYNQNINVKNKLEDNIQLLEETGIQISSKEELLNLINNLTTDGYSKNNTFNLANDIDLEGAIIKPIPIFAGTLNGNNHTIKNFSIDATNSGNEAGFIRILTKNASINDLKLDLNIEVKNNETSVGGFVGTNNGTISNCSFNGVIKARHVVGGIVGTNQETGKIINCINNGNIIGKMFTGGIVGFNKGEVNKSLNKGRINNLKFSSTDELTLSSIGGISGFNQFMISDSTNEGEIGQKQVGSLIGGISGSSVGEIISSINHGKVYGNGNIGGIVGHYAEFVNNDNDPSLQDIIDIALKIIGGKSDKKEPAIKATSNKSSLKYCFNDGLIMGNSSVGGIVGYSSNVTSALDKRDFDINNCVNEGYIQATKENIGGITGNQLNGKIYECFNIGDIDGKSANYVGGIVGKSGGEVAYSFAINDMIGNMYVGGIGGTNNKLHDCYVVSKIDCKNGFVGSLSGQINEIKDKVFNNFYVNDDFYGIDNIDYENKSTRVAKDVLGDTTLNVNLDSKYFMLDPNIRSYPKLKSINELDASVSNFQLLKDKMTQATKFGSYVNFLDEDGDIIKKIFVEYGKDLDLSLVPDVPQKEGHFVKWSDFENTNVTKNLYIKPIYNEIITTIASETGSHPSVLVDGKFYDTSKVEVKITNKNILDDDSIYTYLNTYEVNILDDVNPIDKTNIKIKIALPEKYENIHIAAYINDKLTILDSEIDGNYLVFKALDNNTYYLLDQNFANINNPGFIATLVCSIVGGVTLIGGITFAIIYHKKKTKRDKI